MHEPALQVASRSPASRTGLLREALRTASHRPCRMVGAVSVGVTMVLNRGCLCMPARRATCLPGCCCRWHVKCSQTTGFKLDRDLYLLVLVLSSAVCSMAATKVWNTEELGIHLQTLVAA